MERMQTVSMAAVVLEQDFILQTRRWQREADPQWVVNVMFAQMPALNNKPDLIDEAHDRLQEFASSQGGSMHLMTNGDAFLVVPKRVTNDPTAYASRVLTHILPQGFDPGRSAIALTQVFPMPDSYMPLRERVNYYIDIAKQMLENDEDDPEKALQDDSVQGPLSAYALSQIERLLADLDVRRYARGQTVFSRLSDKEWAPFYEENFIATGELQKEKFPRLELRASGRLFAELASLLDRRMLAYMIRTSDVWLGKAIGLNMSAKTVLSSTFAQFCHVVQGEARGKISFEVHISEMLHDLTQFNNALQLLRQEGFKVFIDGLQAGMLPLLNIAKLPVDGLKLSASRDGLSQLNDPAVLEAIRSVPSEKWVFMHVETPAALEAGVALGVKKFQGFLLDDQVAALASSN